MSAATLKQYSVESPDAKEVPGEGKPRRNALFASEPLSAAPQPVASLYENFLAGVKAAGDDPFLGVRATTATGTPGAYVWQSYNEVHKRVKNFGSGLVKRGIKAKTSVGIFSINRPEWVMTEHACYMYSLITVPLYDTLGNEAIEHIIKQTGMPVIVATKDKAKSLIPVLDRLVPTLNTIIVMDGAEQETIDAAKAKNVTVISFVDVEKEGADAPASPVAPAKTDIATICYTSGTTGLPKGVVLTHGNMLGALANFQALASRGHFYQITSADVHISYLPLAHVFERTVQVVLTHVGARIGFYQGDTLKLLEDIAELKPTVFASVPRLYNRIYDKVFAGVKAKGGIAAALFNMGFSSKKSGLEHGSQSHWLWDRLVFSKVKARLGGRVRLMLTGAAPLAADVMDFLRIAFGADVYEGYGQTENVSSITITDRYDFSSGHVGVPWPYLEVKLVDVPEMGYTSKDTPFPRGEICVRGLTVFQEYYKMPEKTKETLDADGWCHTGDVGMWDAQGRLRIIDRAKNIFKLAQGEYIAPERIETVYVKHELIAQAFVYGDSLKATLVGVIVPDEETFVPWAAKNGFGSRTFQELCKDAAVRKAVLKAVIDHGKANDLKGFENIKNVHLDHEPFSVENELLTPTFKLKRHDAKKKYEKVIEQLYAEIETASS